MPTLCRFFRITGRVQGVGYRAWFEREALALGLNGWVRNRRDGSVEALAWGPAQALATLETQARRGPPAARVEAVQTSPAEPEGEAGFRFLPTL